MTYSPAKFGGRYSPADDVGDRVPQAARADAGELWRILWCRRSWIFAITALCFAAAMVYAVLAPPQYSAAAQILIDPRDRQIVTKDVNPDTLAADGGVIQVESQSRIIESDTVLLRAISAIGLERDTDYGARKTTFLAVLIDDIKSMFGDSADTGPDAARNMALRVLRKHLAVKRADKEFVVDVVVTAATAAKAALISNAIAEAYIADQIETRSESSRDASTSLGGTLDELKDRVRDAETRVVRYKADHDLVGTDKQLVTDQQLEDSSTKLENARAKSAELRARLDQIDALRTRGVDIDAIPEALQSTVIIQLRASYQTLLRRESDLRTRVGDRHPDMIGVVDQVKEAKREINAELGRLANSARIDYERSLAYAKSLGATFDKSKLKTESLGDASVELHELNRELEARRSLYQAFLARSAETKAQADIDTFNARIISKAIPPDQPSWPTRGFILLASLGGGLGLGAAVSLVVEYLKPTILSFGRLERLIDAPVVGVLSGRRSNERTWGRLAQRGATRNDQADDVIALALSRLCGPLGALRGIPNSFTLLVTSAQNDDKARREICDRLTATAAERGIAVLLVEADLAVRRDRHPGFLDVLRGDCLLPAATVSIGAAGAKQLSIGTASNGLKDTLREDHIDAFLSNAARYFDLIIFDVGAFEDNLRIAPLAALVDDVILVAVQGVTEERAATDTSDAVAALSGRPISASLLFQPAARA